jgi:hypothetical protein
MKTQNNQDKLKFDKSAIAELNDKQMLNVGAEGSISFSIDINDETVKVVWISVNY